MKNILALLLLIITVPATACVQLNPAYIQSGPNIAASNDLYASILSFQVNTLSQQTVIQFAYGSATVATGNCSLFTHDLNGPIITMTLNWASSVKQWSSSNGLSGALTNTDLTNLNAGMTSGYIALFNSLEALGTAKVVFGASAVNDPWNVTPSVQ
jgi:hypothetical protein